jgi:precorrin-2 dehydrogenase/sirohydrochlorin ferrochelatase
LAYFPAFIKLDKQNILIVGGGKIATNKLSHLLDFTKNIKIIAPYFTKDMKKLIKKNNLKFENRKYVKNDLKKITIIIVAIDDIPLQKKIYKQSKKYNCLCNSVDSVKYCDFIFPSYIKKDDLTIAISTAGSSPAFAKYFKSFLDEVIPKDIGNFLKKMKNYRKTLPKGKKRMQFLEKKAKKYIKNLTKKENRK